MEWGLTPKKKKIAAPAPRRLRQNSISNYIGNSRPAKDTLRPMLKITNKNKKEKPTAKEVGSPTKAVLPLDNTVVRADNRLSLSKK